MQIFKLMSCLVIVNVDELNVDYNKFVSL